MPRSLAELCTLYRGGKLLPSKFVATALRRQQRLRSLNVFVTECPEIARSSAIEADERMRNKASLGPLDGVTVAFKDNFCTAGVNTSCGSKMLKSFVSPYNATVVERALAHGAVMLGKTNLDEFAMGSGTTDSCHGPTKNVWRSGLGYTLVGRRGELLGEQILEQLEEDECVVAGGSSGGSAVSVAAGIVQVSLGSDTGGSVRIPAAWCGVPSIKPTYGLLSRHGLVPLVNSLDCPGIIARSVRDCAEVLTCLQGRDKWDSTSTESLLDTALLHRVQGLRVGLPQEFLCEGMSEEVVEVWNRVADILEDGGAQVKAVSLPHTELAIPCYSVINSCEVASNMARYDGLQFGHRAHTHTSTEDLFAESRSQGFNDVVRGRILAGNYFLLKQNYEKYYMQALKIRRLILQDFLAAWNSVDLLLTPVTLTDAPTFSSFRSRDNRSQTALQDFCTQPINLAGLPAVTLPVSLSKRRLPLSVQLVGAARQDTLVLAVGAWLEDKLNFPTLHLNDCDSDDSDDSQGSIPSKYSAECS